MFKDIYKEACNEICGDKKAILDKAFERAAIPKKKTRPVWKYSVIGTAAAAIIIVGAVFMNMELFTTSSRDIKEMETVFENEKLKSSKTSDAGQDNDMTLPTEQKEQAEQKADEQGSVNRKERVSSAEKEEYTEDSAAAPGKNIQEKPEDTVVDEVAAESNNNDDTLPTEHEPATGGSGGGSGASNKENMFLYSMRRGNMDLQKKTMTYAEYAAYLGYDISTIIMPDGIAPVIIPDECEVFLNKDGDIVEDTMFFTNNSEEKPVYVTTGRIFSVEWALPNGANIASEVVENDEETNGADNDSEVPENGEETNGVIYAMKDGASIMIECFNVNAGEIESIEAQLAEKN